MLTIERRMEFATALKDAGYKEAAAQCLTTYSQTARQASKWFEELGKWKEAEITYLILGEYADAGRAFQSDGKHREAAECYVTSKNWHKAREQFLLGGFREGAARMLKREGAVEESNRELEALGKEYESKGLYQEAAWMFEEVGKLKKADELLKKSSSFLSDGEITAITLLGGGKTPSYLVTFSTGTQGVFKPDFHRQFGNAATEIATFRLSAALGVGLIPVTVEREIHGLKGSLQYFVPNAVIGRDSFIGTQGDLQAFDFLSQTAGRHPNNYLVSEGRVIGIDNAQGFQGNINALSDLEPSSEFLDAVRRTTPKRIRSALRGLISEEEIESVIKRRKNLLRKFGKNVHAHAVR